MNHPHQDLLDRYFQGRANDADLSELEQRLVTDEAFRSIYLREAMAEADLRSFALQEDAQAAISPFDQSSARAKKAPWFLWIGAPAAAALLLLSLLLLRPPATVGTIVSSELAGWESTQPTIQGAEFRPGTYTLQTGIATLAFHSGAELVMEAPAKLNIVSDMEVRFHYGQASVHVPEQAIGFRVDLPYGHVIDHGTRFSIQLREHEEHARLAVQEGEIAIHHREGKVRHLLSNEAANVSLRQIDTVNDPSAEGELVVKEPALTLSSRGRETSIVYSNQRKAKLSQDLLMVKYQTRNPHVNRRAFLAFDVSQVALDQIEQARLILNAVPTDLGQVTDMPTESDFLLLGIPDDERENWPTDGLLWEDAPTLGEATPLATFSMPRARQRGVVTLESDDLLRFLQADLSGEVSFMIDCQTPGATLVHGFASSLHREAAGPILELTMKDL
ncbi:MAG: FecR domain-containing protein [Verrucomicrobiota bacterium]